MHCLAPNSPEAKDKSLKSDTTAKIAINIGWHLVYYLDFFSFFFFGTRKKEDKVAVEASPQLPLPLDMPTS